MTHFSNHALGLISVAAAEAGRWWFVALWRNPAGTAVLYTALLTHPILGLVALYRRHTLRMPLAEATQLVLGVSVPLLLTSHVVGTRLAHALYGREDAYTWLTYAQWTLRPDIGIKQTVLLVVVWTHACIGLHYWLRLRAWYQRLVPIAFATALLLPALALTGFAQMGRETTAWARPDDVAYIMYTSGTTRFPRGVQLTHHALLTTVALSSERVGVGPGDRILSPLPFFHISGVNFGMLTAIVSGACVVTSEVFNAGVALELVRREQCTAIYGMAAMFRMIMSHPDFSRGAFAHVQKGWVLGPRQLAEGIHERMGIEGLCGMYGATEGSGPTSIGSFRDPLARRLETMGRPLPGIDVKIVDPDSGAERLIGAAGEIRQRGWGTMRGYWGMPDETRLVFDENGYFKTGDLGYLTEDGHLVYLERERDVLKVGGEGVSPAEVEAVLSECPSVALVAVVGLPDKRLEEIPVAMVQLAPGTTCTPDELIAFCRERLADYKVPRRVVIVEAMPLSGSTKVQKKTVRELLLASQESFE